MRGVKNCLIISIFLLIALSNNSSSANSSVITGETVTGHATQSVGFTINIISTPPTLTINRPQNETYFANTSLAIEITSNGANIWYNIDNGNNITLLENENEFEGRINTSSGSHTVYTFANNTQGNVTNANVTFNVNLPIFDLDYLSYTNKGNTTNFNKYSFREIQNLENITIENTNFGMIKFNSAINLTDDENPSNDATNLSENIIISSKSIFLNTTALPNFNKSATLELYSLTFTNPRILLDGSVCPTTICSQNSYIAAYSLGGSPNNVSGGILSFNVTHFTTYSAEETPVSSTPSSSSSSSSGGGGGGGGGSQIIYQNAFTLDKESIALSIKQGETKSESIIITNIAKEDLKFTITKPDTTNFVNIIEKNLTIKSGESKAINLDLFANENKKPGVYIGKLIIEAGGQEKEVLIALDIKSKQTLFDVILELQGKEKEVQAGKDVSANIRLFQLQDLGKVEVKVEYSIQDENGKIIYSDSETLAVDKQANFIKSLHVPPETKEGNYIFHIEMEYGKETASASEWFTVKEKSNLQTIYIITISIIIVLILSIIIGMFYLLRKIKELRKKK